MSTGDWRDQLKAIKIAREEYAKAISYSDTPRYIADSLRNEIEDKIQAVRPTIIQASIAEHVEKIDGFKKARSKVQEAVANEIRRWDARQLIDQMELTRARVQAVLDIGLDPLTKRSPGPDLQAIYQEAKESGDPVRLRATAEVFRSVIFNMPMNNDQASRFVANHLQNQAEDDLRQLKETDELKTAREAEGLARPDAVGRRAVDRRRPVRGRHRDREGRERGRLDPRRLGLPGGHPPLAAPGRPGRVPPGVRRGAS